MKSVGSATFTANISKRFLRGISRISLSEKSLSNKLVESIRQNPGCNACVIYRERLTVHYQEPMQVSEIEKIVCKFGYQLSETKNKRHPLYLF
jgi:hypothetical protein